MDRGDRGDWAGVMARPKKRCCVLGCDRTHRGLGLCSLHYNRMRQHGSTELPVNDRSPGASEKAPFDNIRAAALFARHINADVGPEACWLWISGKSEYPNLTIEGRNIKAHRLSWMLANDTYDLTSTDFICHHCDNRRCVNPSHLYRGDARTNVEDMFRRGRATPTEQRRIQHALAAPRGDQHWTRRMPERIRRAS